MVEATQQPNKDAQQVNGVVLPTAEEKRKMKENHDKFLLEFKKKQQEVVMKFKRSNDAVLTVYVPESFNGQGCISCSADHNARSK